MRRQQRRHEAAERHAVADAEARAQEAAEASIAIPPRPPVGSATASEGAAGVAQGPTLRKLRTARLPTASQAADDLADALPRGWRERVAPMAPHRVSEGSVLPAVAGKQAPSAKEPPVSERASAAPEVALRQPTAPLVQNPFPLASHELLHEVLQQQCEEAALPRPTRAPSQEEVLHLLKQIHPDNRSAAQKSAVVPPGAQLAFDVAVSTVREIGSAVREVGADPALTPTPPTMSRPRAPVTRSASKAGAVKAPGRRGRLETYTEDAAADAANRPRPRKKWTVAPQAPLVLPIAGENSPVAPPPLPPHSAQSGLALPQSLASPSPLGTFSPASAAAASPAATDPSLRTPSFATPSAPALPPIAVESLPRREESYGEQPQSPSCPDTPPARPVAPAVPPGQRPFPAVQLPVPVVHIDTATAQQTKPFDSVPAASALATKSFDAPPAPSPAPHGYQLAATPSPLPTPPPPTPPHTGTCFLSWQAQLWLHRHSSALQYSPVLSRLRLETRAQQ